MTLSLCQVLFHVKPPTPVEVEVMLSLSLVRGNFVNFIDITKSLLKYLGSRIIHKLEIHFIIISLANLFHMVIP